MNWFEKFIYALQYEMTKPKPFGWFHLTSIAIIATLVTLAIVFRKKISRKFVNITMLVVGIALIVSEAIKQCIHSMDVVDGVAKWSYAWERFPFQFCSVPIFLYVFAGIVRKGKVYDTILCFLAIFAPFGGASTLVYPVTVMSSVLYLSLHTVFWHGAMIVIAFMLLATKSIEFKFKSVWKACIVFVIILALAEAMNFIWHFYGDPEQEFNMFYISPYYTCDMPLLHEIQKKAPYIVFFLSYSVGFVVIAFMIMGAAIGIDKLHKLVSDKRRAKKSA